MWLLLIRLWPLWLALAGIFTGVALYQRHRGYESGYAASEAKWQPLFAQAERDRDKANEKARRTEEDSRTLSEQSEKQHAEQIASITSRAADAERSNASLVRQLAARSRCGAMPQASGSATLSNAATTSQPVADRVAADLTELARRCESDSAQLSLLQDWVRSQQALFAR